MGYTGGVVPKGSGAADGGEGRLYTILGQFAYDRALQTDGGWEFADPIRDSPPPQPLLYLPLVVEGKLIRALLDSGASDSFVSWDVVRVPFPIFRFSHCAPETE